MIKIKISPQEKIGALNELSVSLGWRIMTDYLQNNVAELTKEILDDIDDNIEEKQKKILNLKRHFQQRLIELPKNLILELSNETITDKDIDFDPFDK